MEQKYFKVIACEIAARELYYTAARSPHLVDIELLTQGHHDTPASGRTDLQQRIDAVPAGKYSAILLGYALCSNILVGLTTSHTPLVIPRAHDCITFFLGSKERYQQCFAEHPGTYYYTSGWLECAKRRGTKGTLWAGASVPASAALNLKASYDAWVTKYGEEQAKYLLEEMSRWTAAYSHAALIDFDFLAGLKLEQQVKQICEEKAWEFAKLPGDLRLLQNLVNGEWEEKDFLLLQPGQKIVASFDDKVIATSDA